MCTIARTDGGRLVCGDGVLWPALTTTAHVRYLSVRAPGRSPVPPVAATATPTTSKVHHVQPRHTTTSRRVCLHLTWPSAGPSGGAGAALPAAINIFSVCLAAPAIPATRFNVRSPPKAEPEDESNKKCPSSLLQNFSPSGWCGRAAGRHSCAGHGYGRSGWQTQRSSWLRPLSSGKAGRGQPSARQQQVVVVGNFKEAEARAPAPRLLCRPFRAAAGHRGLLMAADQLRGAGLLAARVGRGAQGGGGEEEGRSPR